MRFLMMFAAIAATLAGGVRMALADDGPPREPAILRVPVGGLARDCCDAAVTKALSTIPGVAAVRIEKQADGKSAVIQLKEDATPPLTAISKALDAATQEMRGHGMEVRYAVDPVRLHLTDGTTVVVDSTDSPASLQRSLNRVEGLDSAQVWSQEKHLFARLKVAPGRFVSFAETAKVVESAGGRVSDVVFVPAAQPERAPQVSPDPQPQPQEEPPRPKGGSC